MKKVVDDPRLMIKVCDLYYNQNISQQQIGKFLGLSRPTVSRLLASAREQNIVQITIPDLDTITYWELEQKLEAQYGLREVLIVDSGHSQESLKTALGRAAARYLQYLIKSGDIVGVSMGSTLYHMILSLTKPKIPDVTFVPLIGGMGRLRTELHANSLAENMSRFYDGEYVPLHAPARVSNRQIRDELLKEASLLSAIELFGRLEDRKSVV